MKLNISQKMIDAAPTLPVALDKLTSGIKAVSRAAVRKAIIYGPAETPVVALTDDGVMIVSGYAELMAAHCKGQSHCECKVVATPK